MSTTKTKSHAQQFQEVFRGLVGTENDLPKRLELLKTDRSACEALAGEIAQPITSDTHKPHRAIRDLIQAYIDKNPEGILMALSGWGLDSLIKLAFGEDT